MLDYDVVPRDVPRINYFMTNEDYRVIAGVLRGQRASRRFVEFFQRDLTALRLDAANKKELLRILVGKAVEFEPDLNADELLSSIWAREEMGFTYFGRGVAIPHPNKLLDVPQSFVVAATLRHGLEWRNGDEATLVFLVCAARDGESSLQRFYQGLAEVVSDDALQRRLVACEDFDSFASVMESAGGRLE